MQTTDNIQGGTPRFSVLSFSVIVLIIVCVLLLANPATSQIMLDRIYGLLTGQFGWAFSFFGLGCFIFLLWLAFSRYGKIRLGQPGDKPAFSTFAWISMLFCTGQGSTLIYWSILEPIQYYAGPPFGLEVGSVEAIEYAAAYGGFHWGLIPWALLTVPVVPIAYYYFVKRQPQLSLSSSFYGRWDGRIGAKTCSAIDILVIFATVANCCTCLGIETPTIASLISQNFGVPESMGLNVAIIATFVLIFGVSSFLGLEKGIKRLSAINIYLVLVIMLFILAVGPTGFILTAFTNDISILLDDFFRMALYTDAFGGSGWPQGWTIFYWAWWFCATPFTAIFIAKISRGRTIKEVAIGGFLWGTIGDMVAFGILGGSSIHAQMHSGLDLTAIMEQAGPAAVVATVISNFPGAVALVPLFIIAMIIFSSTTYDSCAYVLAGVTYKTKKVDAEPPRYLRMLWAIVVGFAALTLLFLGGLKPLQSFSLICAIPLVVICLFLLVLFVIDLRKDYETVTGKKIEEDVLEFPFNEEGQYEPALLTAAAPERP